MWQTWVNLIIGLWLIISGVVVKLQRPANFIIVGIIVVILAILMSGGKKEEKKKETV